MTVVDAHKGRWLLERAVARTLYGWNNGSGSLIRTMRRLHDSCVLRLRGVTSLSDSDGLSISYLGLPIGLVNVLQLFEQHRIPHAGDTRSHEPVAARWKMARRGVWPESDIVLIGAERWLIKSLPMRQSIVAPFRVHMVVYPQSNQSLPGGGISKRERWQFQRDFKTHAWAFEEDSSATAFDFFYHHMHVPTMAKRHGDRARTESYRVAREAILDSGTLFFVREGGHPVSAVLCKWSDNGTTLTTRLLGVLEGDDEHYRSGAFRAVYHLLLRWAEEHAVARVDFHGTEALISKGIFQWKRRLGAKIELPPNHFSTKRLYIHVNRDTPVVRDFLVGNPVLAEDPNGELIPIYFNDAQRSPARSISSRCPDLADPRVVDLDQFMQSPTGLWSWVEEDVS